MSKDSEYLVELIPFGDIDQLYPVWQQLKPMIESNKSSWSYYYTIDSIRDRVLTGAWQVWVIFDKDRAIKYAKLTRIIKYPKKRVIDSALFLGKGIVKDKKAIRQFCQVIEYWAKANGIELARIEGRRGWIKVFARFGYHLCGVVILKEIK